MKKKVLFVATITKHIIGFHSPYLKYFKDNNWDVWVATGDDTEKIQYCDKKITIPISRNPRKLGNLLAMRQLKKIINQEKFDIIHCHTPVGGVITRLAAKSARKRFKTRVIYTAHGFHFYKGAPMKNWIFFYNIERYLSKYTDALITINNEDFDIARKKFKKCKDIHLVHGVGIDSNKFDIKMSYQEIIKLKKSLKLDVKSFVLIFPARLDKNKNQIFLIDAMEKLVSLDNNIHLILPGRDELDGYYQKITEQRHLTNNIHFLGYRSDISKLMKISDVSVSSSLREGLPVNVIEAFYSSLPVIALKCRGMEDLVKNGENGYIVDSESEFVEKILLMKKKKLNLHVERKEIEQYSLKNISKHMKEIYSIEKGTGVFKTEKKLIFTHSNKFETKNGKYYSNGIFINDNMERYTNVFDSVVVIARKKNIDVPSNLTEITNARVRFNCIDQLNDIFDKNIRKKIKREVINTDYVIARVPSVLSSLVIYYARKYNKPILVEVVGEAFGSLWNYSLKGKMLAPIEHMITKMILKKSKFALYVTSEFLQNVYPTNGKSINCSNVELTHISDIVLQKRLTKINSSLSTESKILATIAAVNVKYKGQEYVIKALKKLNKQGYNFKYLIVGNGDQSRLRKMISKYKVSKYVTLVGGLPHDQVFEFLDSVDIYIQPSIAAEGLPRSMIEAMSRGCLCAGTNICGIPELIDKKYLFRKKSSKSIANILMKISNNDYIEEAKVNFEKSKEYDLKILQKRRNEFFSEFKEKNEI